MARTGLQAAVYAALFVMLLGGTGGCSSAPEPQTAPSPSASPIETATEPSQKASPTAEVTDEQWRSEFTPRQLRAFDKAIIRWQRYNTLTEPIYATGEATQRARSVLQEYDFHWQRAFLTLQTTFEEQGFRRSTAPVGLSSRASSVRLNPDGTGDISFVQCSDYRQVKYSRKGEVIDSRPKHLVTPLVVRMTKPEGRGWMVLGSALKDVRSCAA